MSHGLSNGLRVLRGCRALLAPVKSSAAIPAAAEITAAKAKTPARPKSESKAKKSSSSASEDVPKPKIKKEMNRQSGILKVTPVSTELGDFMGVSEASRSDAVKKIWSHIKLHNLQNPADKRVIYCDDKLKAIFDGRETVGFLEIGKLLTRHFVKTG